MRNEGETGAGAAQVLSSNDNADNSVTTFKLGYKDTLTQGFYVDAWFNYQNVKEDTYFTIFPAGMGLPNFDTNGNIVGITLFTEGVIGAPALNDTNLTAEVTAVYTDFDKHSLRFSVGYSHNEMIVEEFKNFGPLAQDFVSDTRDGSLTDVTGTPFIFSPDVTRKVFNLSIQDEWALYKDWELTAGVRYDHYSDFGSTINPRAALVWQVKHNFTAKAIYGRAFRAPSFSELYAINNPIILGNPGLNPETINTFEVAFDYRPNFDWKWLFNFYSYRAKNLIVYTPQPDGSSLANNAAKQDGIGGELEAYWQISDKLNLKTGVSWQDAEDALSGEDIADAPGLSIDLAIDWQLNEKTHVHLDSRWIKDRNRLPSDSRDKIPDYNWINANINYNINHNLILSLAIRNLLDKKAYEPSDGQIPNDYPLEERGYWLRIKYSL